MGPTPTTVLGGDEFRRTQSGNNNAWCQDNETSWVDWRLLERHQDIARFTREMIALRRAHPVLSRERFYTEAEVQWFNSDGDTPNWSDAAARQLACLIREDENSRLFLMFNAGGDSVDFRMPAPAEGLHWQRAVDTYRPTPEDISPLDQAPRVDADRYQVEPHAAVILVTRRE